MKIASVVSLLVVIGGWASFAHAVSFVEPFDGLAPGDIVGQNGWQTVDGFIGNLFSSSGLVESPTVPGVSFDGSDSTSPGESSNGFGQAMARDINSTTDIFGGQYVVQADLVMTAGSKFRFGIGTTASIITGGDAEMQWLQIAGDGLIDIITFNDEQTGVFNPVGQIADSIAPLSDINPAADWMQVRVTVDAATGVSTLDYRKLGTFAWFSAGGTGLSLTGTVSQVQAMEISVQDGAQVDNVVVGPYISGIEWNTNADASWNSTGSWTSLDDAGATAVFPDDDKATAVFGSAITAPRTVTVGSAVTVKAITFDNLNAYTITGANITLDSFGGTGNSNIDVLSGAHDIQTAVSLNTDSQVDVDASSSLTLGGTLNLNGKTLTKTSDGRLDVNGALGAGGGSVVVDAGTLGGTGAVGGDLTANTGTTVAPGNSTGILNVVGNYTQETGATLEIEIDGLVSGTEYDVLDVTGILTINGGSLDIVTGFTPSVGASFDILNFASTSGGFGAVNGTPGAGLLWDTSQLFVNGTLSVIAATSFEWGVDSGGDWAGGSNWVPAASPSGNVISVLFGPAISAPHTVFTDADVTVKGITFGDTDAGTIQQSYAIGGQGIVTLEADTGNAGITVLEGSHQFQAVVTLGSTTDVDASVGTTLAFNNVLNLGANDLNLIGAGTVQISNDLNSGTGSVNVSAGVVSGNGSISGPLNNNGATVAPGNSPGELSVGSYSQTAGLLSIEIGGTNDGSVSGDREFDLLNVAGDLTISNGSIVLSLINGFVPTLGDTFDILNFATIDLSGATLALGTPGAGLLWDSSQLTVDGSLSVIASLLGDFDTDGDVDGNDFLAWQRGFGTSFGASDLTDWEGNFGAPPLSSLSGASAAVPEPSSLMLLGIALGLMVLRTKR